MPLVTHITETFQGSSYTMKWKVRKGLLIQQRTDTQGNGRKVVSVARNIRPEIGRISDKSGNIYRISPANIESSDVLLKAM